MAEKYDKIQQQKTAQRRRLVVGAMAIIGGLFTYKSLLSGPSDAPQTKIMEEKIERQRVIIEQLLNTEKQESRGKEFKKKKVMKKKVIKKRPGRSTADALNIASAEVDRLDVEVRNIKSNLSPGHFMETDPKALAATTQLQEATQKLLKLRYGPIEPYRIKVDLQFQDTIPDFETNGAEGSFTIEMAPASLVPHSVHNFLEIARGWKGGAFHRVAGHVLQAMVKKSARPKSLAFQEYSEKYPHKKGTVGYAGRPSGPEFYVSIQDNTKNHGPGSQQKANPHEADSIIGTVVEGFEDVVVNRIRKMPGQGFINDPKKMVLIEKMTILVPKEKGSSEFVEWINQGNQ